MVFVSGGPVQATRPVFGLTKTQFRRPTNLLGEHNQEVFCGLLGLTEDEYGQLVEEQVIGSGE
jgi:crotonobetainyl-CoA:carnitine CoA-transferase CaiB-like acyl-CoA transferase